MIKPEEAFTVSIKPPVSLTAASLAALFALTACSSSDTSDSSGGSSEGAADSGPSVVEFDFSAAPSEAASSIEFRIPDEILEQEDDYRENRYLDSVTVAAVESEDPSECAIEYSFEYAEGGLDRLVEDAREYVQTGTGNVDNGISHALVNENVDSVDLSGDYFSAVVPVGCSVSPSDTDNLVDVRFKKNMEGRFSWAEVSVMKSGELFVHDFDINGWQADSNGSWIKG
ncbi:hypothetical protein [Nocardiopsis alba]|uniref:hypothetical protein n=1 Tax=Nocardiopsis alba TaxID=53437 RepID=UPI0033B3FC09